MQNARKFLRLIGKLAVVGVALLGSCLGSAMAQPAGNVSVAETCLAANAGLSLGVRLPRTAARLKSGDPLIIVAVGSSSTVGLWQTQSANTYPEVMLREMLRLQPNARIKIVNSGRSGDTIPGNFARFDRDVLSFKPDLVVWQLGTNDIAWGGHVDDGLRNQVIDGVRSLKASGADVVLMDLQNAPVVLASPYYSQMQNLIAGVARQERVGLFSRFALMRKTTEAGVPRGALVSFDGLHHSTQGYDCVGRALGRAIMASAR